MDLREARSNFPDSHSIPTSIPSEFPRIDVSGRGLGQDEIDAAIQTTSSRFRWLRAPATTNTTRLRSPLPVVSTLRPGNGPPRLCTGRMYATSSLSTALALREDSVIAAWLGF